MNRSEPAEAPPSVVAFVQRLCIVSAVAAELEIMTPVGRSEAEAALQGSSCREVSVSAWRSGVGSQGTDRHSEQNLLSSVEKNTPRNNTMGSV